MSRILKSISLLWFGTVLGAGCGFLSQVVLARNTNTKDFGDFSAALSFVMLISPLIGFGLPALWQKLFGDEGYDARRWLAPSLRFVRTSTTAVVLFLVLWAFLFPHGNLFRSILLILSFQLVAQYAIEQTSSILRLEGRIVALVTTQAAPHVLRLVVITGICFIELQDVSIIHVAIGYAAVGIAVIFFGLHHHNRIMKGDLNLQGHERTDAAPPPDARLGDLFRKTCPFGLAGFSYLLYLQAGLVVLKYLEGQEAVAVMSIGISIMSGIYILPVVVYQKFFLADFHRWARTDMDRLYHTSRKILALMSISGFLVMAFMFFFSKDLMHLLFKGKMDAHLTELLLIFSGTPLRFISDGLGALLVTGDNMKRKVVFMGIAAVTNFLLNLLFVPMFGLTGCIIAMLSCELLLLSLYAYGVKRWVFPGRSLWLRARA